MKRYIIGVTGLFALGVSVASFFGVSHLLSGRTSPIPLSVGIMTAIVIVTLYLVILAKCYESKS